MSEHAQSKDVKGAGKMSKSTGRYIPVHGGSRSRLRPHNQSDYAVYPGFIGMDEKMAASTQTLGALYRYLGGAPVIPEGPGGEMARIVGSSYQEHDELTEEE